MSHTIIISGGFFWILCEMFRFCLGVRIRTANMNKNPCMVIIVRAHSAAVAFLQLMRKHFPSNPSDSVSIPYEKRQKGIFPLAFSCPISIVVACWLCSAYVLCYLKSERFIQQYFGDSVL